MAPFESKRQARWAFANKEPWAREAAGKTNFKSIPESKNPRLKVAARKRGKNGKRSITAGRR